MIRARIWVDGRLAGGLQALLGAPMAAYSGCGERDGGIGHGKRRSRTGLARVAGTLGWLASQWRTGAVRQGVAGRAIGPAARSNWASQGQRCGRCSVRWRAERVIRRPGEEPPPEGLGGHHLLAQTDARCPAGEVVGHHLYRQPGGVGGEAARGEMVQPHTVLEVSEAFSYLGVAAMVGLQFEHLPVPVGDEAVIAVGGEEGQLGTGPWLLTPDDEPHRCGVRFTSGRECRWSRHTSASPSIP